MEEELNEFYKDLLTRLKELESRKQTPSTEGRIVELQLIIVRVQQILLKNIK